MYKRQVPALRKGQWTTDGCKATGKNGIAFKRATKDCYALVADVYKRQQLLAPLRSVRLG